MTNQPHHDNSAHHDRHTAGREVFDRIVGAQGDAVIDGLNAANPALADQVISWFGDSYARPALDARSRQLVTLAVLAAIGGAEPQLNLHIRTSLNVGIARDAIYELFLHAAAYAGYPRAINATNVAKSVFDDLDAAPSA